MKFIIVLAIMLSMLSVKGAVPRQTSEFPVLRGSYLGQEPPGMEPEKFAPGTVTTAKSEGCSGWGNQMDFFVFQRWIDRRPVLYIMENRSGTWTPPRKISVLEEFGIGDFTLASDGRTLVFASRKTVEGLDSVGEGANIWKVSKTDSGWSEPRQIGFQINTKYHESYPSLAANGNLYFFSRGPGGIGQSDLYFSQFSDGRLQRPVNMGKTLNTPYHEWDPYIAPDENYMIFCSTQPGGLGEDDLYVTFRNPDGTWRPAVHLGPSVNSPASENRPYVSPDGKFLFYTSNRDGNRDIYWVDAQILWAHRPGQ